MNRRPFGSFSEASKAAKDYDFTIIEANNITQTHWLLIFDSQWEKDRYKADWERDEIQIDNLMDVNASDFWK